MARARTLTLKTQVEVTGADKLNNLGKKMQSVGRNLTVGVTLPIAALGGALLAMSEEAARADAELQRTFDSMGAAAFTTVDALKATQKELQSTTTFADEEISHLQSVLLTFGNVTGESFDRATAAALDMSTLLGQDLQSSAVQLGKALNDPIAGLTALRRVGVSFTESQKEQIRVLTESGDVLAAQGIILDEVERQFGGAAEAIADTAGGQLKQAFNELADAGEEFGAIIAPVLAEVAGGVREFTKWLGQLNPETREWIIRIGLLAAALGPLSIVVGTFLRVFSAIPAAGGAIISIAPRIGAAFTLMLGPIGLVITALGLLATAFATDFLGMRSRTEAGIDFIAIHFGELGDAANALSEEFGLSFDEIKEKVAERMGETGESIEDALKGVKRELRGVGPVVEDTAITWAEQMTVIQDAAYGTMLGPDGVVQTFGDGVDAAALELGELPQKGADELLANQFHLTDAVDQLVAFMDAALDPADELFQARMFLASQAAADGIASGNPLVRQKTQELIDAANAVLAQHGKDAFNYGVNFSAEYARGIVNNLGVIRDAAQQAGGALRNIVGINSEPQDHSSPLYGITKWGGNFVQTWVDGMLGALPALSGAANTMAGALSIGTTGPRMATALAGGSGTTTIVNNYYLQWDGEPPKGRTEAEIVATLQRLSPLVDGKLAPGY